jgi:hypothetical protein
MDLAPLARIIVRYAAGALVAKGIFPADTGATLAVDPDVINYVNVGLGLAMAGAAEFYYWLARKFGWSK